MRSPDHRARARDEVVGHERDADVVIRSSLERVELAAEIAPPRERDHTDAGIGRARLVDELDARARLEIDIDEDEVRVPLRDRRLRAGDGVLRPADVGPVPERQVDRVRECAIADRDEDADHALRRGLGAALWHRPSLRGAVVDPNAEAAAHEQRPVPCR